MGFHNWKPLLTICNKKDFKSLTTNSRFCILYFIRQTKREKACNTACVYTTKDSEITILSVKWATGLMRSELVCESRKLITSICSVGYFY